MNLDDGIRFECQGSGQCCVSRNGYGFVYLTTHDRRRMAKHLGLSLRKFTHEYCVRTDGHYHLVDGGGACRFLQGKRCTVYRARPEQCRTWPFWPENLNAKTWEEVRRFCPGVGKGPRYSRRQIQDRARRTDREST